MAGLRDLEDWRGLGSVGLGDETQFEKRSAAVGTALLVDGKIASVERKDGPAVVVEAGRTEAGGRSQTRGAKDLVVGTVAENGERLHRGISVEVGAAPRRLAQHGRGGAAPASVGCGVPRVEPAGDVTASTYVSLA
jgi:hypothetical protein